MDCIDTQVDEATLLTYKDVPQNGVPVPGGWGNVRRGHALTSAWGNLKGVRNKWH